MSSSSANQTKNASPLLTASQISLSLNGKKVVDSVDITAGAGEFVGLIGPNGAGKSSVLRMLAGLVKPASGCVQIAPNQTPVLLAAVNAQMRARFVAYLAQKEIPAWPLSVKNLVALGRSPWAANADKSIADKHSADETAINRAMQMTEVNDLAERPVTELSGGELQRALLARVFAGQPRLILADEPISALDVYHQLHIMELLQSHAQGGGAVIAALHDLSLAARFCSRLVLLHQGKIVASGEPVAVLTPQNLAQVYGVSAHVDCRHDGVVIIPTKRIGQQ